MKKVFLSFILVPAGLLVIGSIYFAHFYYHRYQNTVTELETHVANFEMRLGRLEAHKARELTPHHIWGWISTTNVPLDDHSSAILGRYTNDQYEAVAGKGVSIVPELRISPSQLAEFDIHLASELGPLVNAWFSQEGQVRDLAAFEELRLTILGTNMLRVTAKTVPGASVRMNLQIVVLSQK